MFRIATCIGLSALLVAGLTACNKPTTEADAATTADAGPAPASPNASAPTVAASAPAAGAQGLLKASASSAVCEAGSDIRFDWDVTSKPSVASVEVWVGEGNHAKLFAAGGPQGSESTGPWVKPATVFILRDKATQQELDRIEISGPACPPEPAPPAP